MQRATRPWMVIPSGVRRAIDASSRLRLARVRSSHGRCRLRTRFVKSGRAPCRGVVPPEHHRVARSEPHDPGHNEGTVTMGRAFCLFITLSCATLVGCGASAPPQVSGDRGGKVADAAAASQSSASDGSATQIPDVCGLLSPQQIDAVLGAGFHPVTYAGTGNGYLSPSLVAKIAPHNWIHKLDPAITLLAAASCSWIDRKVSIEERVHPTLVYNLATYSASVPEWVFLKEYAPTKPYPPGFGPVHGMGSWAFFDGPGGELAVAAGHLVLTVSNSTLQYGDNLREPYIRLARQILRRLG
jgi:hypothetical protein